MRQWLLVVFPAVLVLGIGIGVGVLIGRSTKESKSAPSSTPSVTPIGDVANGAALWSAKGCSGCHSIAGKGGKDAPPLDFMRGKLSEQDIANMSGTIWNHTPSMAMHFSEEKIPFPTFNGNEMADLIAFIHGGAASSP